jgi:hypothetical protein
MNRMNCKVPPLCYDFSNVATYLERPEVVATLGVKGRKWSDCNHVVAIEFELAGDWMVSQFQSFSLRCARTQLHKFSF